MLRVVLAQEAHAAYVFVSQFGFAVAFANPVVRVVSGYLGHPLASSVDRQLFQRLGVFRVAQDQALPGRNTGHDLIQFNQ